MILRLYKRSITCTMSTIYLQVLNHFLTRIIRYFQKSKILTFKNRSSTNIEKIHIFAHIRNSTKSRRPTEFQPHHFHTHTHTQTSHARSHADPPDISAKHHRRDYLQTISISWKSGRFANASDRVQLVKRAVILNVYYGKKRPVKSNLSIVSASLPVLRVD